MKKYLLPGLILAGILLFSLVNATFVDASHPDCHYPPCTTTTTHPDCHYPPCTTTTTTRPSCTTTTTTTICPSPSVSISAAPPSIPYNGSAVLHWTSTNTNYCTASASPYNYQWKGSVNLNGNKSINSLIKTTTFSITCTNYCGTVTDNATVYVQAPVPTRYSCNTNTWQCVVNSSGPYTSFSSCDANCQAPQENFDFSLSNSGNIVVTKPTSGSITRSNIITASLTNGSSKSVSFSQSGLPYGVSVYSLYSCYPTCSKTNTLIINSYASIGTFPVTVTATGGGITRTTIYNITIQDSYNDTLSVSCYASPNPAEENERVTFRSNVSGGSGNYSYDWSGATHGSNSYSRESFSSDGNYTAYLTVHDSQNRSASTSCRVHIDEEYTNSPTLNLWADEYTIAQGESTYLRWTSNNTDYCTASNGWSGSKSTSGYESVSPNSDTTYKLICYGNGDQITRSVTIYVTSLSTNLNLTKLGRNLSSGDRMYSKVIRVTEGDVIEFYLTVTAGSNKDLYNVNIKDFMPSVLNYMPGTTKINGIVQPDTITTTGLQLGTLYKGAAKTIIFQAISSFPGTYLTFTNTAEITADNESKITDSASITYGLVAGAATIRTGPLDTLLISFIISLISSLIIWYYLRFNPKGQLVLVRTESKIRDIWLAYTRNRIMR